MQPHGGNKGRLLRQLPLTVAMQAGLAVRVMQQDVFDLRAFYNERALGRVTQRILRERLTAFWPPDSTAGMTVAGFGFPLPVLLPYLGTARRVVALMPAAQGALRWPAAQGNRAVLCEGDAWPIDTGFVDRLVLLHGLENAGDPAALLAEAWRVLGPGGRMVVLVPNRTGLWARAETTPFGTGRSYTVRQLDAQARAAGFVAERHGPALYIPPSDRRFWLRSARLWERTGSRIASVLVAGLIVAEFSKQVRAPRPPGVGVRVPSPLDVLEGITRPRPQPGRAPPTGRT